MGTDGSPLQCRGKKREVAVAASSLVVRKNWKGEESTVCAQTSVEKRNSPIGSGMVKRSVEKIRPRPIGGREGNSKEAPLHKKQKRGGEGGGKEKISEGKKPNVGKKRGSRNVTNQGKMRSGGGEVTTPVFQKSVGLGP